MLITDRTQLTYTEETPLKMNIIRGRLTVNFTLTFLETAFLMFSREELESKIQNPHKKYFIIKTHSHKEAKFNTWLSQVFPDFFVFSNGCKIDNEDLIYIINSIWLKTTEFFSLGLVCRAYKNLSHNCLRIIYEDQQTPCKHCFIPLGDAHTDETARLECINYTKKKKEKYKSFRGEVFRRKDIEFILAVIPKTPTIEWAGQTFQKR